MSSGQPVKLKVVKPLYSTVVVLDIYGSIEKSELVSICPTAVTAIALDDGTTSSSNAELDDYGNVHVHPVWLSLSGNVHPPEDIVLEDCDANTCKDPSIASRLCNGHATNGSNCMNRTRHCSGLCWRHRP